MDKHTASPNTLSAGVLVVGRIAKTSGSIVNYVLEGHVDLAAFDAVEAQQLIQRPSDWAMKFSDRPEHVLAFVGVAFGPAPNGNFEKHLWKGDFDEAKHPRVPGGCPEGGEFCAANETPKAENSPNPLDSLINQNTVQRDLLSSIEKKAARAFLRNRLLNVLRGLAGLIADIVPYAGELFDIAEIEQAISDGIATEQEVKAALNYARGGPKDIAELQVEGDRSFITPEAFKKEISVKYYGPAGEGWDYHHVVWKGGENGYNIPKELMNSPENMIRMPRLLHEVINEAYRAPKFPELPDGPTIREWMDTQPYEVQREEGIKIMRRLGILK